MIQKILISVILGVSLLATGCSFSMAKAESNRPGIERSSNESNTDLSPETLPSPDKETKTRPASVTGTYEYDTEKNGEGYDNSLEVTDAGDGKLNIFISGAYIYKVGETQSMHEAEGKGDAILRGSLADATLVDEAGKPCRATITFTEGAAEVKIPDGCQFNVALGGVYKKAGAKKQIVKTEPTVRPKNLGKVKYEKVMDFINDYEKLKPGQEFTITDVPPAIISKRDRADEFGNKSYKGLFYLQGITDDDTVSYSVLTSKAMIDSLDQNAEHEPVTLRMHAVIAESKGKFDIYRLPFITKIEGLNEDGSVMWTAVGAKPAKVNFVH